MTYLDPSGGEVTGDLGACPACGGLYFLLVDGAVRPHTRMSNNAAIPCTGSREIPTERPPRW